MHLTAQDPPSGVLLSVGFIIIHAHGNRVVYR